MAFLSFSKMVVLIQNRLGNASAFKDMCAKCASVKVVASLHNWYQGKQHINKEEYEFLEHVDNLATLTGREGAKDQLQKFLKKNFATQYSLRLEKKVRWSKNIDIQPVDIIQPVTLP